MDRDARIALWRSGRDLSTAWLAFGDERQRQQQIERSGTPASLVIQNLMMGDVFGDLADGELIAMGYRVAPSPSDGPVRIPSDVFEQRLPETWGENVVSASGYTYERIRVLRTTSEVVEDQKAQSTGEQDQGAEPTPQPGPRKRGPKPLDRFIKQAIASLLDEDGFLGSSQEVQIRTIIARAEQLNRARFAKGGPSHTTVWRYLQAHPLPEA